MQFDFSKRNYIVTGGNGGIGHAIVEGILAGGGRAIVIDLAEDALTALKAADPDKIAFFRADLSGKEGLRLVFREILERFGEVHGLVNCAGIVSTKPFPEISDAEWETVLRINLSATFIGIQEVFSAMASRGYGRIVNIGSVAGKVGGGLFGTAAYATSKAGVMGLTKAVAKEGAPYGIACNCVNPGYVMTHLTEALDDQKKRKLLPAIALKRGARPEEIANLVVFYLSDLASYITGEIGDADGGLTFD